ncbi:MAG: hypothetical protein QGI68_12615 [Pseudomonadales bacterium]|jgi:hypothetical protein|nr:hypothetical protein [Pseudomonadales bacterium]HJN51978.1 hypothetical protein [Pseudomonadales bacterium]
MMRRTVFLMAVAVLLAGCQSDITPVIECVPDKGLTPICGFQNPEDLAAIPDSKWLIVSQFGSMNGTKLGNLALFDRIEELLRPVFPNGEGGVEPGWGDADCPGVPGKSFSPHGLDLMQLADGRWRLAVVNHGSRESVELFEVVNEESLPRIIWRGCAVGPDDAYFNDVVILADGGFLVTHMMPKSAELLGTLKGLLGMDTGHVLHWSATEGFRQVAGTEAPFPNGIEISDDEEVLFLNVYMGNEVRKIRRSNGELLAKVEVVRPDNITWGSDGRLLVASHVDGLSELVACQNLARGACGFAFEIVALDPGSMSPTTLLSHRGAPMGAATVAVQIGTRLYLGSFAGDRIVYAELAP